MRSSEPAAGAGREISNLEKPRSDAATVLQQPFTSKTHSAVHNSDQRCQLFGRSSERKRQPAVTSQPAGTKLSSAQKSAQQPDTPKENTTTAVEDALNSLGPGHYSQFDYNLL